MTDLFRHVPGRVPVLVDIPHAGTHLPSGIAGRLTDAARALPDTDWHVDRLYDFAAASGCAVLVATHSRYVVDLNRDPSGRALYPGATNTGVCPTETFAGDALYRPGRAPDAAEIEARIARYWRPYHARLAGILEDMRARFGVAVLFDAHSIRAEVPRLFEGRLPDLNLGTADGRSADRDLEGRILEILESAEGCTSVLNGRFKGGYITRHYGRPADGVHALQLEMAQSVYMEEAPPFRYREDLAARIRPTLERAIAELIRWAEAAAR